MNDKCLSQIIDFVSREMLANVIQRALATKKIKINV